MRCTAPKRRLPTSQICLGKDVRRGDQKGVESGFEFDGPYRIDVLEHGVTEDIEGHVTTTLDTSVCHAVSGIGETEGFFVNGELLVADSVGDNGQLIRACVSRIDVSLVLLVVLGTRNGIVDGLTSFVGNQSESGAGIHDRGIPTQGRCLSIDRH